MLADHLDKLSQDFPDCVLSAFVDIGTGIVLLTNEKGGALREIADALCAEANDTFGNTDAPAIGLQPSSLAIKSDESHLNIYIRSATEASEALLCRCRKAISLESFLPAARDCLARLSDRADG
jgi:hypothetical protein